jgi:hypothetical protein
VTFKGFSNNLTLLAKNRLERTLQEAETTNGELRDQLVPSQDADILSNQAVIGLKTIGEAVKTQR